MKHKPTRYKWKNLLGKDFASRMSLETNKISMILLGNKSDIDLSSETEHTLGEIQNAFVRSAEEVLRRRMFKTGKNQIKKITLQKNSLT